MPKTSSDQRVRYAVVGLGHISQTAVLPAFEQTNDAEICALVSRDEAKRNRLAQRYGVDVTGTSEELERVLRESRADAVYIATNTTSHRAYTERAANAGLHVLVEKPMAPSVDDCRAMIASCKAAGVKLMVAYRLHFDEASLDAITIVRAGQIGVPRLFMSVLSSPVQDADARTQRRFAGGAAHDLGVDPINTARHLFGAEPIAAFSASTRGQHGLRDVDATTSATLVFDDERMAQFSVSLATSGVSSYRLLGDKGDLRLEPAYAHDAPLRHVLTIGPNSVERRFIQRDQFAAQIRAFSRAIRDGADIGPTGEEGLADVRVVEALVESQRTGRLVDLPRSPHVGRSAWS
ncbi:MAG TPA: Gfo/Idh/MocA family oxidoreductase [Polyangiaceae bacterium]|nr:Gfo/Idh/MocA family oxidoreductase [Polyangiaceae bacterium]